MKQNIYTVYDIVAETIVGPLVLVPSDAAAIRHFSDTASDPKTTVGMHPKDYILITCGNIDSEGNITPEHRIILEGKQWHAMQEKNTGA